MQTIEYHLYRTKFIKPSQVSLFNPDLSAKEMLEAGLDERPSIEFRRNNVWHIGNVEYLDKNAGRFAIGRTTTTTVEKFDNNSGNFTELIDESGPYTFVYFDSSLGLLGIGKKIKVASDVKSIARKIQSLLAKTNLVALNQIDVRVDYIPDPDSFLEKLHSAYAIKRFKAHFTGPNPVDADDLFQRPMSYYCQQLEADQGSVIVSGDSLNEKAVAEVAKSTAATANAASAIIQSERGVRTTKISFKGDARKIIIEQDAEKNQILESIKLAYREVRD